MTLFHPEIASESNFYLESHLVQVLPNNFQESVDAFWNQVGTICSTPYFLLYARIFFSH